MLVPSPTVSTSYDISRASELIEPPRPAREAFRLDPVQPSLAPIPPGQTPEDLSILDAPPSRLFPSVRADL